MNVVTWGSMFGDSQTRCRCKLCGAWFKKELALVNPDMVYDLYCPVCHEKGQITEEGEMR